MLKSDNARNQRLPANRRLAAMLGVIAIAATGCGQDSGNQATPADEQRTDGQGNVATFVAVDIAYEQTPDTLPPGTHTFELVNDGAVRHTVTIAELDDRTVVATEGGETTTGRVELDPGSYTYYCNVPGHREAGMEGTLEVG